MNSVWVIYMGIQYYIYIYIFIFYNIFKYDESLMSYKNQKKNITCKFRT